MSKLDEIFAHKRAEVDARRAELPLSEVIAAAAAAPPPVAFEAALRRGRRPALIAEVKAASPSRGPLAALDGRPFDPVALARTYAENGAAAISVLTDARYFGGSLDHLRAVRAALPGVPLLRKDFTCDPYQVYEARAAGADAVLLIVAHLDDATLADLAELARSLGMAALVEVHTATELPRALAASATLIGINNRNLHDFSVRLETAVELAQDIPDGVTVVGESGIVTAADIARLSRGRGVDAILVGEALVTAPDIAARVRELASARNRTGLRVKICGIRTLEDALAAAEAGADMLGFNFYPPSPRYIARDACAGLSAELRRALRQAGQQVPLLVGVFVNTPVEEMNATLAACDLDAAQLSGDEAPGDVAALGGRGFKAIRPRDATAARRLAAEFARPVGAASLHAELPALLVDATHGALYGGSGVTCDWQAAAGLAADAPILLAGGLDADNIGQAVAAVHPWGVDVASGVERAPGTKDAHKLRTFIARAKAAGAY